MRSQKNVEMSQEQFARWIFQHELSHGQHPHGTSWSNLDLRFRRSYMNEAARYLEQEISTWPDFIQVRFSRTPMYQN